jgi:hypothetical protein
MIKRIRIRDFKSIRGINLDLGTITVLVGRSGTGKSNVVHAIRFLRNYLLNSANAVVYEGGWQRIVPVGEQTPRTFIEVTFELPGADAEYRYEVEFAPPTQNRHFANDMNLSAERLSLGKEILFARSIDDQRKWTWEQAPAVVSSPPLTNTPMLGLFPSLQKVVFAYAALSTGIGFYHFPSSALDPQWSRDPRQDFLQSIPGLADDARNFREVMRRISQDFHNPHTRKNILASLRAVNPSVDSVELDSLTDPQRAVVGHLAGKKVFDLSLEQESDGFRRFYAHLLALYQTPAKLVLVFEEPENAIFPGAMSLLADEFKSAPRENRGQVILTTHNPSLLDHFDVESVRVVEMRDGETCIGPVAKDQRDAVKSHLLKTGELLTVDSPRMESAKIAEEAA